MGLFKTSHLQHTVFNLLLNTPKKILKDLTEQIILREEGSKQ